ncbi:hypothetical protein ACIA8G_14510 [Lentzea sp. NPDC051213]|uniref:hypothetical protein n=1 Tax=Lentzea sp. NPDC051213 TaxID=3364126 RepID=UPI0037B9FD22
MLKFALKLDGVASFTMGVLALLIRPEIGLPAAWLIGVGIFFVVYGAGVFTLGTRTAPDRRMVLLIIIGNAVWGVDSVLAAELKWFPFTDAGVALVLAQALAVFGFAILQSIGLRSAGSAIGRGTRRPSQTLA